MSFEAVKEYFEQFGMGECCVLQEHSSDTVEHAAAGSPNRTLD